MKWIGISMVLVSCTLFGFLQDLYQKNRVIELDKFAKAFELFKGEIEYRLTPVAEALRCVAPSTIAGINAVFIDFSQLLEEKMTPVVFTMWKEAVDKNKSYFHLRESDYKLLYEFGNMTGGMDKQMQTKSLELIIERIRGEYITAKEKYDRTTLLNKYLGILVGVCVSIFLI